MSDKEKKLSEEELKEVSGGADRFSFTAVKPTSTTVIKPTSATVELDISAATTDETSLSSAELEGTTGDAAILAPDEGSAEAEVEGGTTGTFATSGTISEAADTDTDAEGTAAKS